MATNESIPYWDTGDTITCVTSAAVTGCRFVKISGARQLDAAGNPKSNPTVAHAAAATDAVFGVAAYDAASGAAVTVHHQPAIVCDVESGGVFAAGDPVVPDASGRAVKAGTGVAAAGIALDASTGAGQKVPVDRSVRAVGA